MTERPCPQEGGELGDRLREAGGWDAVLEQVADMGWTRLDVRCCARAPTPFRTPRSHTMLERRGGPDPSHQQQHQHHSSMPCGEVRVLPEPTWSAEHAAGPSPAVGCLK